LHVCLPWRPSAASNGRRHCWALPQTGGASKARRHTAAKATRKGTRHCGVSHCFLVSRSLAPRTCRPWPGQGGGCASVSFGAGKQMRDIPASHLHFSDGGRALPTCMPYSFTHESLKIFTKARATALV
jgi:hypothetical protein